MGTVRALDVTDLEITSYSAGASKRRIARNASTRAGRTRPSSISASSTRRRRPDPAYGGPYSLARRLGHNAELLHHHPGVGHAPVLDGQPVVAEADHVRDRHGHAL